MCWRESFQKNTKKFTGFLGKEWKERSSTIDRRGEFVLLVHLEACAGDVEDRGSVGQEDLRSLADDILKRGAKPKSVAKLVAGLLSSDAKEVYRKLFHGKPTGAGQERSGE